MSLKNAIVKTFIKSVMKKRTEEQMVNIIRTTGKEVKYDDKGFRIREKEIPSHLTFNQFYYNDVRLEEMYVTNNLKPANEQKVILLLHGGGYIGRLNDIYTDFMCKLCDIASDYRVYATEYRTSDIAPAPAAYTDTLTSWNYLMEQGYLPQNIILMGDSAGGGLALSLAMYLRDNSIKPKAYMGLSPWVNLNCDSDCFTNPERKKEDPLFGNHNILENLAKMYVKDNDPNDWRLSPLFGSMENLPPIYITYGSIEVLRDDIQELYDRASTVNEVVLKVYKGCQHDIQVSFTKETKQSWKDMKEYINNLK